MNKHITPDKTTLFKNKLSKLLEKIQRTRETEDLQTKEAHLREAIRLVNSFYRTITEPNFSPDKIFTGTHPDRDDFNETFRTIADDLDILFAELENVEGIVLEHFNLIAAQSNRLSSRIKRLNSRATDFALYSKLPVKNSIFVTDSFSNVERLEPSSNLLNASECNINEAEGVITLPLDTATTETVSIELNPTINSNSNGRRGNNEELASALNDNIAAVLDGNADTWFEYERVLATDDNVSLVLDFTLNLQDPQVINHVRINPNNFGQKTEVEVVDITTSIDGNLYISIKDDIPIAGYLAEDEDNVFILAPSTSKFAGQGLFTFTPRKAKYIRVTLRQNTPYAIQTTRGTQLRYAIGLRDVVVQRQAYQSTGEVVSVPFTLSDEIKKVALRTNQNPLQDSDLASIQHQVSFDDGNTWVDIAPLESDGIINSASEANEIVNVNTADEGSIETDAPATSIRYKAILSRNDDAFTDGSSSFASAIKERSELHSVPASEPWFFTLDKPPLDGSVSVVDPGFGSRGYTDTRYLLGTGTGGKLEYVLPFELDDLFGDLKKNSSYRVRTESNFEVLVDGEQWEGTASLATAGSSEKKYQVTRSGLSFGDGTNGKSPDNGSKIELAFTPERLYPIEAEHHKAELLFPIATDRSRVSIFRRGPISADSVSAEQESTVHRLNERNIVIDSDHPISFSPSAQTIFTTRREFKNGKLSTQGGELTAAGDYSVDQERGIIYSYSQTTENDEITIKHFYQPEETLLESQWTWGDEDSPHHSVEITDKGWGPTRVVGLTTASGVKRVFLKHLGVIKGTVEITDPGDYGNDEEVNPFLEEVEFFNGRDELTTSVRREEVIEKLTALGTATTVTFTTSTPITSNTNLAVTFSNTDVFNNEETSAVDVDATGDYYVDRTNNQVTVYVGTGGSVEDPGSIYYWSDDPGSVPDGAYSIDYIRGIIYTARALPSDNFVFNYQYSEYYIKYDIAREVPSTDWEVDIGSKTVTILPAEIMRKARIPGLSGAGNFRPVSYQVNYNYISATRDDIDELASYFTPVLKDYSLQLITRSRF